MQGSKKIPINDLNQLITCKICNGYFIDATTIIECLHTFCRSCIVKYLESNKYCPVCDVQVHKTKPLLNIRPDKTIQDIVYKLVPRLFQNETQRRKTFYDAHPEAKPSSLEVSVEAAYQYLLSPEESICLTLNYHGSNGTPRYLRCPAAVSLGHLKKLIRAKYDLTDNHRVEILYNQDCLNASLTLMDVAYIYAWKRKGPIELTYRIYECSAKKLKLETDQSESAAHANHNNNNWKEVQLRISESGEMSITGIQDAALGPSILEIVNSDQQKYKNEVVTVMEAKPAAPIKKELPGLKYIGKGAASNGPSKSTASNDTPVSSEDVSKSNATTSPGFVSNCATLSSGTTTTVFSTINSSKCSTKSEEVVPKTETNVVKEEEKNEAPKPAVVANNVATEKNLKRKNDGGVTEAEPPVKQPKQTILNHSLGLMNLSNNHPLKKHSKLNRNGESIKEIVLRSSTPGPDPAVPCPAPPPAKPPTTTTTTTKTITVTTTTTTDTTFSKPSVINKNLICSQPCRPGTPISSVAKPVILPTKPSIIPPKPSVSVYTNATKSPCYMPKTVYNPVINVPKPVTSSVVPKGDPKPSNTGKNDAKASSGSSSVKGESKTGGTAVSQQQIINLNSKLGAKSKPNSPIGYKTLRDPPKSWNSQISKANLNKPSPDPKYSELKNVRPAKFFKMRNNMPRYLGNPASGVKPMYQVQVSPEKEKSQETAKPEKSEIRKHSIVKIDPKTLKPISEKAPETTSLSNHSGTASNHNLTSQAYQNRNCSASNQSVSNSMMSLAGPAQSDLKINTSSVSIFNPLKLQSSPKNERRSPKSPHSPKLKSQPASSPTGSKRDKVNLNFTPPNPFVPNLASPTMSPNQFLYPTGPPGFPPYDPRMMAAYHSLWYGQGMGFPASPMPRLNLDLNQQRKNFEMMPSPTSPKMAGVSQQGHSPQISTKMTSTTSTVATSASKPSSTASKPPGSSKKAPKEPKGEKSLETTVEKLTQNRTKEISGKNDHPTPPPVKTEPPPKEKVPERPEPPKEDKPPERAEPQDKEKKTETQTGDGKPSCTEKHSEEVKSSESVVSEAKSDRVEDGGETPQKAGEAGKSTDLSGSGVEDATKDVEKVVEGGK